MKKCKFPFRIITLIILIIFPNVCIFAQPSNKQMEVFRTARTVRIEVHQSYGKGVDVSLPFEKLTVDLFNDAGVKVVKTDKEDVDINVKIEAQGRALRGNYGLTSRYTGASVSGTFSFITSSVPPYQVNFSVKKDVPSWISLPDKRRTPSSAPFSTAAFFHRKHSFTAKFLETMKQIYGLDFAIATFLHDRDSYFIKSWARKIILEAGPASVDALINGLKENNRSFSRCDIISILGNLKDNRALEPLLEELKDSEYIIRHAAVSALENFNNTHAVDAVIGALQDKEVDVRSSAIRALGKIGDTKAVKPLISKLKDSSDPIREDTVDALGKIGDAQAIEPLINMLGGIHHKHQASRDKAAYVLKSITGQDFGTDRSKWKKWWKQNRERYGFTKPTLLSFLGSTNGIILITIIIGLLVGLFIIIIHYKKGK